MYKLIWTETVLKKLKKMDRGTALKIVKATEAITDDPFLRVKRLVNRNGLYSLRVGDYRLIVSIQVERSVVIVLAIGHRRNIYDRI